ncbi:hypothetical protein GCM10023324_67560 [Streptomyces youssoufiensis]
MGNGEFEGQSLESLHAMLAGSDPAKLANAGNALSDAAPKITEVGNYLRSHATRVEWRGEGADSFREWSHHFALEVMRLGEFTGAVGNHMVNAGQALTEAKAAVPKPVDAEKAHGDPDADKAHIADGTTKLQQAIHQMERLSSYYRAAKEDIAAEREPEFKPLAIDDWRDMSETPYGPASAPTVQAPAGVASVHPQSASAGAKGGGGMPIRPGVEPDLVPGGQVGMGLDGAARLPNPVQDSPAHLPPSVEPAGLPPGESLPTMPARVAPVPEFRTQDPPGEGRSLLPHAPSDRSITRVPPTFRAKRPPALDLPEVSGGHLRNPSRPPSGPRLPRGLIVGEEHAPFARGATPGGLPTVGSTPPGVGNPGGSRRNHEYGGPHSPSSPAPVTANSPRGMVAGEERGGPVRGPLPGTAGGVPAGGPGGVRGASGGRTGQGLAIEPGGAAAARRVGSSRSAGFTPGGAGLVRGSSVTPSSQQAQRQSQRPESNDQGGDWPLGRDTVPPTVE